MKILIVWQYYQKYLDHFYNNILTNPKTNFEEHISLFFEDHFGWPSDLAQHMISIGLDVTFVISNAEVSQKQWAKENNFINFSEKNWEKEILYEQIKRIKPDFLWLNAINLFGTFVKRVKSFCKKIIIWISHEISDDLDFSDISILLTSQADILGSKSSHFGKVIVTNPGFNRKILEKLDKPLKKNNFIFIGSFTKSHKKRVEILAYLVKNGIDVKIFGNILNERKNTNFKKLMGDIFKRRDIDKAIKTITNYSEDSKYIDNLKYILKVCQKPVFGLEYYKVLSEAQIGLNIHSDISGDHADNMRMFETTGVGTCLMTTESPKNIKVFEPGKEILTFKSKEHLLDILINRVSNKTDIKQISKAGQERTLKHHTIENMYDNIKEIFV